MKILYVECNASVFSHNEAQYHSENHFCSVLSFIISHQSNHYYYFPTANKQKHYNYAEATHE